MLQRKGDLFHIKMAQQPLWGYDRFTHCWIEHRMSVMAGFKKQKNGSWEQYHMAVWATSNREASLKAEVLFDITYKVEWRSDLDFVRCVKQIYSLSFNVNCRECESYLFTEWQKVKCFSRGQWIRITVKVEKTVKHYKTHKSLTNRDNIVEFLLETITCYIITTLL